MQLTSICDVELRYTSLGSVFVTSFTFRTADSRYAWLNSAFAILEGVLDNVAVNGLARGKAYVCEATVL